MLLVTNRRPVVHLPLAHEGRVQPREVADRFFMGEVAQALGERREARLAAHEDGRPDHLAQIKIGGLLGRQDEFVQAPVAAVLVKGGSAGRVRQRLAAAIYNCATILAFRVAVVAVQ